MTPRMTTCGTFSVLGVASRISRGSERPGLSGRIWKMFESRQREIGFVATQEVDNAAVQFDAGRASFGQYPEETPEQPVQLHIPVRKQPAGGERAGLAADWSGRKAPRL